jgi:hypothetical protein
MAATILTIEDLQQFKRELIEEFRKLLSERQQAQTTSKWLKSHQVRRILTISPGTLQQLRVNGTLPFTKIGGVIYYDAQDIENMLQLRKQNVKVIDSKDALRIV